MGMSSGCKVAFNYLTELSKLKPFSFWPNFPEAGPSPQSPANGMDRRFPSHLLQRGITGT